MLYQLLPLLKPILLPLLCVGLFFAGRITAECKPCQPVIQVQQQTVETELATPVIDATAEFLAREKQLKTTIDSLRAEAKAARQGKHNSECLSQTDLELINKAAKVLELTQ